MAQETLVFRLNCVHPPTAQHRDAAMAAGDPHDLVFFVRSISSSEYRDRKASQARDTGTKDETKGGQRERDGRNHVEKQAVVMLEGSWA